jgi:hypothetical protein
MSVVAKRYAGAAVAAVKEKGGDAEVDRHKKDVDSFEQA